MNVLFWTGVVVIGGAGSVVRFLVDGVVASGSGRDFPSAPSPSTCPAR